MCALRGYVTRLLLVVCLVGFLAGCPFRGDNGLALLLTPDFLNFETDQETLIFQVHRNLTNSPVEPVVVSSSQPWIIPESCTSDSANCLGTGLLNSMYITVSVDRNKMSLGTNRGSVFVRTGGAAVQKIDIYAEDMLLVDFLVNNRAPAVGQAVSFDDASEKTAEAGDVVSRLWDFGDNTTSTATDPVHVYSAPGLYSVSLTITTTNSVETTRKSAWITVGSPAPNTNFEASETSIFEGDSVVFSDTSTTATEPITSRLWNFGDGRTSTSARPEHQYTQAGAYTVKLTVTTTNASRTETKTNFIIVQRKVAPEADFSVNPSSPVALVPASFGDISDPGSSAIIQWFWDFGDGTTSRSQSPTHAFAVGGAYDVTLSVVSSHGSDSITKTVTAREIPPIASFSVSDTTPFVLETVSFFNASIAGSAPIDTYLWEFGDGASSDLQNPTHSYNSAGEFTVRLTAISTHGSHTATSRVTVSFMAPVASFSAADRSPSVGSPVQFMDASTPGTAAVNQWLWDFGDPGSGAANMSATQNPTHTYNAPGFYTITLTVTTPVASNNSATITRTNYIEAIQAPVPSFQAAVPDPNNPDVVQFTSSTVAGSEPITSHLWDFGDTASGSNTSTSTNPTHRFTRAGNFTVTLTVETATRSVMTSQTVTVVFVPPTVEFSVETVATPSREEVLTDGALTTDTLQFNSLITLGTEMDTSGFAYAWDFGDGNMSDLEEPTHSYDNGGSYTVTYTVTTLTDTVSASHIIEVDAPPVADFNALPRIAPTNAAIQFFDQSDDSGSSPILSRLWEFGDGSVSVLVDPTHSYTIPNEYTVSLTLSFDHGTTGVRMSIKATKAGFVQIN